MMPSIDPGKGIVILPLKEYEELKEKQNFWQNKFNVLYGVILENAERDMPTGDWRIKNQDFITLALDIEEYLNTRKDGICG